MSSENTSAKKAFQTLKELVTGIISKQILQRINSNIVKSTNINQWKNTDAVIKWFSNMPGKSTRSFICFDIVDFYPSISEELLNEALIFASQYDEITENEKAIIMKTKQSLLFNRIQPGEREPQIHFSM